MPDSKPDDEVNNGVLFETELPVPCKSLGFTGTQRGMTPGQKEQVAHWLCRLAPLEVHHGDCTGADAEFHALVRELLPGTRIVIHPPTVNAKRAFCEGDEAREPLAYLARNRVIVTESEVMLAAPGEQQEKLRSGTWATWRDARKRKRPAMLLLPK